LEHVLCCLLSCASDFAVAEELRRLVGIGGGGGVDGDHHLQDHCERVAKMSV